MTVFMLSLTGVPPTLGFVSKFYLFRTVIEGGYIGLAVIGGLTSLVSAYYYLRVVVIMYMWDGQPEVRRERWITITAFSAAIGTVLLTIFSTRCLSGHPRRSCRCSSYKTYCNFSTKNRRMTHIRRFLISVCLI